MRVDAAVRLGRPSALWASHSCWPVDRRRRQNQLFEWEKRIGGGGRLPYTNNTKTYDDRVPRRRRRCGSLVRVSVGRVRFLSVGRVRFLSFGRVRFRPFIRPFIGWEKKPYTARSFRDTRRPRVRLKPLFSTTLSRRCSARHVRAAMSAAGLTTVVVVLLSAALLLRSSSAAGSAIGRANDDDDDDSVFRDRQHSWCQKEECTCVTDTVDGDDYDGGGGRRQRVSIVCTFSGDKVRPTTVLGRSMRNVYTVSFVTFSRANAARSTRP